MQGYTRQKAYPSCHNMFLFQVLDFSQTMAPKTQKVDYPHCNMIADMAVNTFGVIAPGSSISTRCEIAVSRIIVASSCLAN